MWTRSLFFLCISHVLTPFVASTPELDRSSFDRLMKSGRNGMVKFYQPWCGHCTKMKPDWDLLAENVHPSVFIADVNCQVEVSLCGDFHTGGNYPTVLIFERDKEPALYEGGRGYEDLMKFVDENLVEPCDIKRLKETCSEKEQKYAAKWAERTFDDCIKEQVRMASMKGDTMTYELEKWLVARIRILKQIQAAAENEL